MYVYIYILWLATKLHNSSRRNNISGDLIIVPTILCKCALWSTLWTSWNRFETESEDAAESPARPFVTITRRQHTNIVVQSQSQCQIAFGLQLYSSEHLSLSGSLWNHTQARAHTRGDTHAHRRAREDTCARGHRNTHTRTHAHTHTHAGLNTEHGQSEAISPHALVWGEKVEGAAEAFYLERFVVGSLITIHSLISPNLLK